MNCFSVVMLGRHLKIDKFPSIKTMSLWIFCLQIFDCYFFTTKFGETLTLLSWHVFFKIILHSHRWLKTSPGGPTCCTKTSLRVSSYLPHHQPVWNIWMETLTSISIQCMIKFQSIFMTGLVENPETGYIYTFCFYCIFNNEIKMSLFWYKLCSWSLIISKIMVFLKLMICAELVC